MKKVRHALNPNEIMSLPTGVHSDGAGLKLKVSPGGGRCWLVVLRLEGRRGEMGLGSPPTVGLKEARKRAEAARELAAKGEDPREQARTQAEAEAKQKALTFGGFAKAYIAEREGSPAWTSDKTVQGWKNSLLHHAKPLHEMGLREITTDDIVTTLESMWREIPSMAEKTQTRIERVLDAAKALGKRTGDNPARWTGHLEHLLARHDGPVRGPHKAMTYADVPAYMKVLRATGGIGALALEWTILNGSRSAETFGATWAEVDFGTRVWAVPVARCKNRKTMRKVGRGAHRIPLSSAALAVLERLKGYRKSDEPTAWLFPGEVAGRPISNGTMERVLDRHGYEGKATVHGFRSSFRDWAGDAKSTLPDGRKVVLYTHEACEIAIGHIVGSAVERAYRRGDLFEDRVQMMEDWASHLAQPAEEKKAA